MEGKETVYVIGHKNPDTDSVCSAICYARLKEKITGQHYVAKRAGHLNEETQYVMDKLGIQPPEYMRMSDHRYGISRFEKHRVFLKRFQ
mgnify:CR=1 FL=1